jgi:broad specificity phosphatase PhoE
MGKTHLDTNIDLSSLISMLSDKNVRFLFARHGEALSNIKNTEKDIKDQNGAALTNVGTTQAEELKEWLAEQNIPNAKCYTSLLARAVETFEIAFPNKKFTKTSLLNEVGLGDFDNVEKKEDRDKLPSAKGYFEILNEVKKSKIDGAEAIIKYHLKRPGKKGESDRMADIRGRNALINIAANANDGDVFLIVGHSSMLNQIFDFLKGKNILAKKEPKPDNCSVREFIFDGQNFEDKGYIFTPKTKSVKEPGKNYDSALIR